MRHFAILCFCIGGLLPTSIAAHPGGLAADGCHNDRKSGGRHCHRAPSRPPAQTERPRGMVGRGVYFPNCAAVRAAGAAPIRVGTPGYGRHLDRDGDGAGCE
ncbi:excalibur calcium-binding domain-containing protein [Sphingopyxis sp.]|uniref:excalibur calcium-binding domain-containing protein n=1 Tax=Sphingopyxis sp. TaxID=1908224 RepID=UPI00311DD4A7